MADKSMKVTYREYVVEADEKGSISVTKNGEVCDNAKGALREIAQQAGFEVDPNWTSRQFGSKLIKFLSEGTPAPAAKEPEPKKEEPKKEEPKQKVAREITEKDLYKGEILLKEYICPCCESKFAGDSIPTDRCPLCGRAVDESKIFKERIFLQLAPKEPEKPATKYDANSVENSTDFYKNDYIAFEKNWKSYTPKQIDAIINEAEGGDAFAQFKLGYIINAYIYSQFMLESMHELDEGRNPYIESYNAAKRMLWGQFDLTIEEAVKWLSASANQGFGLAMLKLESIYIEGPKFDIREAGKWIEEASKVLRWSEGLYYIADWRLKVHIMLQSKIKVYENQLKEKENQLEEKDRQLKEKDKYITERDRQIEGKDNRIDGLEEELKQLRKDYEDTCASEEKFRDKYLALKYTDSRSSSSSSSSYDDDEVSVLIKYKATTRLGGAAALMEETISMSKDEYKSLLKGSMKARVAYVENNCHYKRLLVTSISDVSVSLA